MDKKEIEMALGEGGALKGMDTRCHDDGVSHGALEL